MFYLSVHSISQAKLNIPWKRNNPTMLLNRPRLPTMTMIFGLEISGGEITRPSASRAIDMQRATRNTPLISAPRISARCHPYEFADDEGDRASLIVYSATTSERTSLLSQHMIKLND
jgi:hypothetical protein